ncbi:MAG: ATP-binding protein [candidate division Zixibacteria bacterium]|nr:ATP-binding protein [candidate division Zixibacteria bacterium]NIR66177.1 ATP-binding protein [candidate division Zixibacteria bacterium]NIS17257.1 ATP-binding protein [candidate division Zixibacteria bacterium]NIS47800.1 ATP-binding protein [candidate division Zixibacteria bacterium]NIT53614.1 ATP-binding protein [candidate division Zixibacteria bacterium]
MATFDHIPTLTSRIAPFVLDHNQCKFLDSLSAFCEAHDSKELISRLCSCIDDFTEFHIAYVLLRPECEFGNNLPRFADLSTFDLRYDNSGFVMRMHDDGLEIFAVIKDKNCKRGRLNLALAILPESSSNPRLEAEKLSIALEKSAKKGKSSSGYAAEAKASNQAISATTLTGIIKSVISKSGYAQRQISCRYYDGLADSEIMIGTDQVREVIDQILTRVREATPEHSGIVEIDLSRDEEIVQICIIIKDNRSKIRPELLRMVKEPHTSTREGGSGLDLAVAESICRANGGKLQIDSPANGATRVKISFPRKERPNIKE